MNALRRIEAVSHSFAFSFPAKMLTHLKSFLGPDQKLTPYLTRGKEDVALTKYQAIAKLPGPVGVICVSTKPDAETISMLVNAGIPTVLIDEVAEGASSVSTDNYRGGYLAGEHLAKLGCRRPAIICGTRKVAGGYNAVERVRGFCDALRKAGLTPPDETSIVEVTDYSYQEGLATASSWLERGKAFDSVFVAAGDDCAIGVLRALQEHGVKCPDDIAVVGYDDIESAKGSTPPLTTIRKPLQKMASLAVEMASDPSSALVRSPRNVVLDPELVVRASAPAMSMAKRGAA